MSGIAMVSARGALRKSVLARPPPIASGQRACFGKANRRPRHAERGAQPRQPPQPRWKRTRPAKQMSSVARILVCASPNSSPAHAAHALRTARRDVRVVPLATECRVVPPTLWRFCSPLSSLFGEVKKMRWQIAGPVCSCLRCATQVESAGTSTSKTDPGKTGSEPRTRRETTRKRRTASRPTATPQNAY